MTGKRAQRPRSRRPSPPGKVPGRDGPEEWGGVDEDLDTGSAVQTAPIGVVEDGGHLASRLTIKLASIDMTVSGTETNVIHGTTAAGVVGGGYLYLQTGGHVPGTMVIATMTAMYLAYLAYRYLTHRSA